MGGNATCAAVLREPWLCGAVGHRLGIGYGYDFHRPDSIRGRDLVVYLIGEGETQTVLLSRLGKHKMGKSCLYFRQLADLDRSVLEKLVVNAMAEVKQRYG